jgi:hypothetical protein
MALKNTAIGATNTTIYASVGNNAISTVIVCNTTVASIDLTLYAVANSAGSIGTPSDTSMIVKELTIPAGDTVSFDQEKMVLTDNDTLIAIASAVGLSATVSTLPV